MDPLFHVKLFFRLYQIHKKNWEMVSIIDLFYFIAVVPVYTPTTQIYFNPTDLGWVGMQCF
jgi:hypothetical protein